MTQPWVPPNPQPGPSGQQPGQPKRWLGPLLIIGGLVLILVLVVGTAVVLIVNRADDKPSANQSATARTKPSDPKALEFRRVLSSKPGACPTPAPSGTACDDKGTVYTLGKVELDGSHVSEVKAGLQPASTSYWYVNINLDPEGAALFGKLTASLAQQAPPGNLLAIVVRGRVVAAPAVQSAIPGGQVQISGSYTRESAEELARQITG